MTCGHSFMAPFPRDNTIPLLRFTFQQMEKDIKQELYGKKSQCHEAYLIYCPTSVEASDPEIDPISGLVFDLPHYVALFAVMKKEACNTEVGKMNVNFDRLFAATENLEEVNLIGFPHISHKAIRNVILPDMDELQVKEFDVRKAFQGSKSLIVSPGNMMRKNENDNMIALTNPAAPRMSGSPLIYRNQVIGLLTGSLPLEDNRIAVKVSLLAKKTYVKH